MLETFPRTAVLVGLMLSVGGCALTPRSGPTASAILSPAEEEASYELVELTPATMAPYLVRTTRNASPGLIRARAANGFSIGPGDTLRIVVFERSDGGTFATTATGGTVFQAVRVDDRGTVTLPYAGRVRVAGGDLQRAAEAIRGALASRAVDPQVHVEMVSSPGQSVLVAGEVKTPGRVTTTEGPLSAVEAIARSGGPTAPPRAVEVTLNLGGSTQRMPYSRLLEQPPIYLNRGDSVVVEANAQRFTVAGAVTRPGLHEMVSQRMSLLDGLGVAGGLNDDAAHPGNVFVFRLREGMDGTPRPLVMHLNLAKAESMFVAQRVALQPDDAIYVTNAPVYEIGKFVTPLVRALAIGTLVGGS
ncbi:polysaccharide biosynthesis/export family protein [Roseomonas xinghualingensis]|uniref:polysaccharide biosynthesis/export family protein n=1 Tax=Roseomonas xinghualingensis TaxID=2986475 RepID=UPI0021F1956B|nr:polysaccharide biosynthesis/export family protein [Roseomonas sp. SXEYE001]MCV4208853.1 polysaccharide export protein [Roseomonas sp. SXEYE001]